MGIEVGVPPESEVLRPPPLYGVCEQQHHFIKLLQRQRELTDRRDSVQNEMNMKSKEVDFLNGALDDISWTMNSWIGNMDTMGRDFVEPPLVPALVDIQHPIMEFIPMLLNPSIETASHFFDVGKSMLVSSMHFQDAYNFDIERVQRCLVHYGTMDPEHPGKVLQVPFCAMNSIHRETIESKLAKQKVDIDPNEVNAKAKEFVEKEVGK